MRWARAARNPDFPLDWERVLWSGRAAWWSLSSPFPHRYHLTDLRVVIDPLTGPPTRELALTDIGAVDLTESRWQRLTGTSTVVVRPTRAHLAPLVLADIHHGPQLALVLQLLVEHGPDLDVDADFLKSALIARASDPFAANRRPLLAAALLIVVAAATVAGVRASHQRVTPRLATDDPLAPGGLRKDRASIVRFMEDEMMPVARRTLGPLKGGPDRVTCATCHGHDGEARGWRMPGVQALPEPDLRMAGLEQSSGWVDAQVRNAIYGYLAEEDKQGAVAYMRAVVLPEMARLLHRPVYDFTQSYDYNVSRGAIGCYHCHQVH